MLFSDLETERLALRNISTEDTEFIFRQFSDPVVCRYLYDDEPYTELGQAEGLIRYFTAPEPRLQHRWIVVRKSDGVKMGTCGFHHWRTTLAAAEVGYDLREEFWGQGYMLEAMRRVVKFAAEDMKLKMLDANIYPGNTPSVSLARKLGFRVVGGTVFTFRGEQILHDVYALDLVGAGLGGNHE